jgi:hypothetical protein
MTITALKRQTTRIRNLAAKVDVKEYAWCQRGCENEKISLIGVCPTKYQSLSLLIFKTEVIGEQNKYFTGMFYSTESSAIKAGLKGSFNKWIETNTGNCGLLVADAEFTHSELKGHLDSLGMSEVFLNALIEHCDLSF